MTLALVAGGGDLPLLVAQAAPVQPLVCAYEAVPLVAGLCADLSFRLETLGSLLEGLRARGVTQVCFAGAVPRPALDPSKLDAATLPLVPVFMKALQSGDDGALRAVVQLFEDAGFEVRAAHEVAPGLLARGGSYGGGAPDEQMQAHAQQAAIHLAELSPQDIGQACVAGASGVLAMEDARGTDAMLAGLPAELGDQTAVLVKAPKTGQSRLVDLPTVGPETLVAAQRAGLAGVAVAAGDVLVLHPEACAQLADELGLSFWAYPAV